MPRRPYRLHVLSHTHWDREWYQTFQGFRKRLVFHLDALLDLMESDEAYRYFHLDGQTACLLDYLEVRPENRDRLCRLIESGRILIGPWFTMPDELLLSGESLVRNLLLGHRLCRDFGTKPMPVGYVTDIFGHNSQFPQILKGFGIDCAMLHRGTSGEDETTEMVWEGADGTEVLLIKIFVHSGYADFLKLRHFSDEQVRDYERQKAALATTHVLHALDGNDHEPARPDTAAEISRFNTLFEQTRASHSSMTAYLRDLWQALGPNWTRGRRRLRGELRSPAKLGLCNGVMNAIGSGRIRLKQENDTLEYLLARVAEPLHAWAVVHGGDDQKAFLDRAWRYLLLNHPHDSIVGCSLDDVHRDMLYRFDQVRALARDSVTESIQVLTDHIDTDAMAGDGPCVTVFNMASTPLGPTFETEFEAAADTVREEAAQGRIPVLEDAAGQRVPMQIEHVQRRTRTGRMVKKVRQPQPSFMLTDSAWAPVDRFRVRLVGDVPALGYRTWRVAFVPGASRNPALPATLTPARAAASGRWLDNGLVRLSVRADGRIDLHDAATNNRYRGLHEFEDCGDAGEGWNHKYPDKDTVVRSRDAKARSRVSTRLVTRGRLAAAIEVEIELRVPESLVPNNTHGAQADEGTVVRRSKKCVPLRIRTVFTLAAGERRIECHTTIENTARSHRLRVLFPTGVDAAQWSGDSAFDVVRRPIALMNTAGWKESAREETPIKNFAAICDRERGLAVATRGLNEACVQDRHARPIALTLFRSFCQHIGDYTRDSLELRNVTCEYAILPFTPCRGMVPTELVAAVDRYKMPPTSLTYPGGTGPLTSHGWFVRTDPPVCVSTIKTPEQGRGLCVRLFNPLTRSVTTRVAPYFHWHRAWRTDLREQNMERLTRDDGGGARVKLRAKQVDTIKFSR